MHINRQTWLSFRSAWKLLVGGCVAIVICLWLTPAQSAAHILRPSIAPSANGITLDLDMGFDSQFRDGYWTPIEVRMTNNTGANFSGTLSVSATIAHDPPDKPNQIAPWSSTQQVTLPKGAQQQLATVYLPYVINTALPQGFTVNLLNSHGKVVASQTADNGFGIKPGILFAAVLTDQTNPEDYFGTLTNIFSPDNTDSLKLTILDANSFPSLTAELNYFDIIVLDDFSSNKLHPDQLLALQAWVNHGGNLVEVGGSQWQQTIRPLPNALLPVVINGTTTIPKGTVMLSQDSPLLQLQPDAVQPVTLPLANDVTASTATFRTDIASPQHETIMSVGTNPLLVESRLGQGTICYLAIDLGGPDFRNWGGVNALWTLLFFHAQSDKFLISPVSSQGGTYTGPGQLLNHVGILDMVKPEPLQGPIILFTLLMAYALLLGPIRLLVVKRLKKPQWWSWRIILTLVVLSSILTYGLANYQRGTSIVDNSVSLIQVSQGGTVAHETTYSGIFVPTAGDFTLHFPGRSLAQPISNQYLYNDPDAIKKADTPASIAVGPHDTSLKLQGLDPWTLHYAVSEQDIQLPGGINAHIALNADTIVGTVENALNTPLSDVYLLFSHSFIPIGHLASGETKQLSIPISSLSFQPGKALADQIAESVGLPAGYFPYTTNGEPQSELQRHIALLSALNSAGFTNPACDGPCKTRAITMGDNLFVTGGHVPNPNLNDYEPLMVPGTPATLIGWADQPLTEDATINGWHPTGNHDNFIQMPLALNIDKLSHVPPGLIVGHPINTASIDAELTLSGIYTMNTGNITFEIPVPATHYLPITSFTVTIPDFWAHPFGPQVAQGTNTSHLEADLYNWRDGSWDTLTLTPAGTFTTLDVQTYMGPDQQVLLQIDNKDINTGKLFFGRPTLSLN